MKIVEGKALPIRIPLKKPFMIAVGALTHSNHVLVKLTDDEGRVGWGETSTFPEVYGYDQKSLFNVLTDHLIPAVIGLDPSNILEIHRRMDRALPYNLMAKTGVDIAVYDLAAQAFNTPLYSLLGGRRIGRIPLVGVVDIVPAEDAAISAIEQAEAGFETIKIKIGKDDHHDLERVKTVRKAVGNDIKLRVDGNAGYDRGTAEKVFKAMEEFDLEWIEQPLVKWDLEGMARLAKLLDTPVAADESVHDAHDAHTLLKLGAADVINIKVVKCGGLYRSQKIASVCAAGGAPCFLGGTIETTPGMAAGAHFYAATQNVISAAEILGSPFYEDDVVKETMNVMGGYMELPEAPGLGVAIDEDKVAYYKVDFS